IFIFLMALTCAHAFFFKLHQKLSEKDDDDSTYHTKSFQPLFGLSSLFHKLQEKPNLFERLTQKNEKLAERFEDKLEKLSEKLEAQFTGKHNDKFDQKLWSLLEEKLNKKLTDPLEILPPSYPKPAGCSSYSPVVPASCNHHHSSPYGCHNDCNDDSYGYFT
ncbi:hypothetical protein DOY81_009117, partial [Sarcophaga bullata]